MNWFIAIALFLVVSFALSRLLFGEGLPRPFSGTAWVIDGDTLEIAGKRIRLHGIDTPEMGQRQGPIAKNALVGIVNGRTLTVRPIETDPYERIVAQVLLEDGRDISEMMVARGWALASTRYTQDYARAQRRAKADRTGFWAHGGIQDGAAYRAAQ